MSQVAGSPDRLDDVMARLDRIEARLDRVVGVLDRALPAVAMATDAADELVSRAAARGVDVDARGQATLQLVETVTEPRTMARIGALLAQLEKLEPVVTLLAGFDDTVAMAADVFDAWAAGQAEVGVELDGRVRTALELLEVATRPAQANSVRVALELLPKLESTLVLASTLDDTIAMAADTFDAWAADQAARGIDIGTRVSTAVQLLETVTDPVNAEVAERMVAQLPRLEPVVQLATTFEPTTAMLFDMFDEHVRGWIDRGIDAEERFLQVASLVERLTDPTFHHHLETQIDAAPGLMAATRTGELFGMAVDRVQSQPAAPMGAWALFRALGDPEVQRAAGFAVAVAREVGSDLPETTQPARS